VIHGFLVSFIAVGLLDLFVGLDAEIADHRQSLDLLFDDIFPTPARADKVQEANGDSTPTRGASTAVARGRRTHQRLSRRSRSSERFQ